MFTVGQFVLGLLIALTLLSVWLGKEMRSLYLARDAKKTLVQRITALLIAGLCIGSMTGVTYSANLTLGPTVYRLNTSGIIIQGTGIFDVTADPTGLNVVSSITWGNMSPGETKSTVFYLINKGSTPITFSYATLNWTPTNGPANLEFLANIGSLPLQPGSFRKVTCTLYVNPTIAGISTFSFDIEITGAS